MNMLCLLYTTWAVNLFNQVSYVLNFKPLVINIQKNLGLKEDLFDKQK